MSDLTFDYDAARTFVASAISAADHLVTSAGHGDRAAEADLSGLGAFGQDFAAAWSTAWAAHAATMRTGAALLTTYGSVVTVWGNKIAEVDEDAALAQRKIAEELG